MDSQRGFTLVEVLIVVAIIGILANIAIPQVQEALWRARASSIVSDFVLVRKAALEFYRDNHRMPVNGTVSRPAYVWENWGDKKHGRTTAIRYGFSLKRPDPELVKSIRKVYDGPFEKTVYQKYTFPITAY